MTRHYFTFGAEHVLRDGQPARDEYVVVEAPERHRELFLAWRGGTAWSSEYSENEWLDMASAHYGPFPHALIKVTEGR